MLLLKHYAFVAILFLLSNLLVSIALPATLTIVPYYVQTFDSNFQPRGKTNLANTQPGEIYQFNIRATLSGALPGQDLGLAIFNVQLTNLQAVDIGSGKWLTPAIAEANGIYAGFFSPAPALLSYANYDSNGPTFGGIVSHWQNGNSDLGSNPNDLQAIVVEASAQEAANRQYGEANRPNAGYADQLGSNTLLGTVLVQLTGPFPATISITPIIGSSWGLFMNNQNGTGTDVSQPAGTLIAGLAGDEPLPPIPNAPEPAAIQLMAIAFGLFITQRREWQKTIRKPGRQENEEGSY